jgi:hypothetical protein
MRIYIIGNDGITLCREAPARTARGGVGRHTRAKKPSGTGHSAASNATLLRADHSGDDKPAYRLRFSIALRMRFTKDWDIRNVRAMVAGLTPARNDARMRFAVPSENPSISLALLRIAPDWPCDDIPVAAALSVSFLGALCLRRSISTVTASVSL